MGQSPQTKYQVKGLDRGSLVKITTIAWLQYPGFSLLENDDKSFTAPPLGDAGRRSKLLLIGLGWGNPTKKLASVYHHYWRRNHGKTVDALFRPVAPPCGNHKIFSISAPIGARAANLVLGKRSGLGLPSKNYEQRLPVIAWDLESKNPCLRDKNSFIAPHLGGIDRRTTR